MNYSKAMEWVTLRAKFIQGEMKDSFMKIEYYFMALAHFVSIKELDDQTMFTEQHVTKRILAMHCGHEYRVIMNRIKDAALKNPEKLNDPEEYLKTAEERMIKPGITPVTTDALLSVILERPGAIINEVIKEESHYKQKEIKEENSSKEKKEDILVKEIPDPPVKKEKGKNDYVLVSLAAKVGEMSQYLLERVKGQDHAVRAFAEGYFHSELLFGTEGKQNRPRATFLFAGPPGMGKTFLAGEASKYLELPYLTVDMSSCSDNQLGVQYFQGIQKSYKDAKEGIVTGYVKKHKKCVLIFDEMEKAHKNVLHLFYQMLDRGVMRDLNTEEEVSFRDTIIIMTTNVGHNLYEGREEEILSRIPNRVIINALKKDINPATNEPFFPEALVTRMAAGTILMFNYLKGHNLQDIIRGEMDRNGEMFRQKYGIEVEFANEIPSLIMYQEGGISDARSLSAQARAFFKSRVLQCIELFHLDYDTSLSEKFKKIRFVATDWKQFEDLDDVFKKPEKQEILIFGNDVLGRRIEKTFPEYRFHITSREEEAFEYFAKYNIELVLLDLVTKRQAEYQKAIGGTLFAFDKLNYSADGLLEVRSFIKREVEHFPEVPVYLLDRGVVEMDEQLLIQMIRLGVRGKVDVKEDKKNIYKNVIENCLTHSRLQQVAQFLRSRHYMVKYETSPYWDKENKVMEIRTRNYELAELIDAEDQEYIVSDAERPNIRFDDVVGAHGAKEELKFFLSYLKNPKQYLAKGMKPPKGVFFYGPPGTGKTMLAKAMAGESDITFISESASNFVTKYAGSGPQAVRDMFKRARRYAPAILFIDEIDAIGKTRKGDSGTHSEEATLNTLLTELDGFKVDLKRPVFLIAATNFKVDETRDGSGYIDKALVRRFDRKILIDLPNKTERMELLTMLCKKNMNCLVTDKMIANIAGRSAGLSNALLSNVVDFAVREAEKRGTAFDDALLEEAYEITIHGEKKNWGSDMMERVAWHESCHAYMYWKIGQTPSYLTIVARGNHGGYMQKNDEDMSAPLKTKEDLLASIRVSLAGRAGEMIRFGKEEGISTGISADLRQATRMAKSLICDYGMDEEFGLIYIDEKEAAGSALAMEIHKKAAKILNEQMKDTIVELSANYHKIEKLVNLLLEKNSLTGDEIKAILEEK